MSVALYAALMRSRRDGDIVRMAAKRTRLTRSLCGLLVVTSKLQTCGPAVCS